MKRVFDTEVKLYTLCILVEDTPGMLSQVARLFSRKGSALPDEEVASPRWPLPVQAPPATLPCLPVSGLPTMSIGLTLTSSVVWVKSFLLSEPLSPSEDGWSGMR